MAKRDYYEILGVARDELDLEVLRLRSDAPTLEQCRDVVHPHHHRVPPGRRDPQPFGGFRRLGAAGERGRTGA